MSPAPTEQPQPWLVSSFLLSVYAMLNTRHGFGEDTVINPPLKEECLEAMRLLCVLVGPPLANRLVCTFL